MPLIDLRTDLKSLKYGQDQPGGGNSGQPYITVDINKVDTGFNRFRMTKFDDGLVRGGVVGAVNASVVDTLRIGKFLKDFPKGPLFIVKQVGLQLSNPQLEHKTNFPTSRPTKGQGLIRNVSNFITNTANKILNAVGPTRIYNLGINTLAQVPVNAFGQHIVRHGFTPRRDDDNLYFKVAQHNNNESNNRLVGYRSKFQLGDNKPNPNPIKLEPEQLTINNYISGPGSTYGIGRTFIRRYSFTEDGDKINFAKNRNYVKQHLPEVKLYQTFDFGISNLSGSTLSAKSFDLKQQLNVLSASFQTHTASANDPKDSKYIAARQEASASQNIKNFTALSNFSRSTLSTTSFPGLKNNSTPSTLLNYTASNKDTTTENTIGKWRGSLTASADLGLSELYGIPKDINTINNSINKNAVLYSNPINKKYSELRTQVENQSNIDRAVQANILGSDLQNALNIVKSKAIPEDVTFTVFTSDKFTDTGTGPRRETVINEVRNKFKRTNDIVVKDDTMALQFTPLNPFSGSPLNVLSFLGYLNNYNEDYNSTWNSTKYVGRAESFYIFNEFKRTASISFQVPCFNEIELIKKHCDVSELASTLAGKYENNLLGGIITRLKLGNYINNQPGIITNLNFTPIEDSSWDLDLKLAYYLKVSFGFTFIHDYLPQYYECGFIFKEPEPEPAPPPPSPPVNPEDTPPRSVPEIEGIRSVIIDNTRRQSLLTPGPGAASFTPAERRAIERSASNTTSPDQNRGIQTVPTGPIKTVKLSDVLANRN
jgi:hypothetical protein